VDRVYARLTAMGVEAKAPPRVTPWGMYGFGVLDPNGVPVNVYEPAPLGETPGKHREMPWGARATWLVAVAQELSALGPALARRRSRIDKTSPVR
jgi:hypothetical protein